MMKVDFDRERGWWDAKASREEQDLSDEAINRALRWREIERHLVDVQKILTVGGGTGVFSIPLAGRGFSVTHVDISPAMLDMPGREPKTWGPLPSRRPTPSIYPASLTAPSTWC